MSWAFNWKMIFKYFIGGLLVLLLLTPCKIAYSQVINKSVRIRYS